MKPKHCNHHWTSALVWLGLTVAPLASAAAQSPLTVAERSGFRGTSRYADVMAFLRDIDRRSPLATLTTFGESFEGRELPLLILADPPISTAEQARGSGKLILFAFGNIHGGEVCGKAALQMLAREIALAPDEPANRALLDEAVILLAPIYNADGNERISPDNRPGQNGPVDGVGQRANAQRLDLNRDWMKLEAPETRAMVRLFNEWQPNLTIDTHTTNGSFHRLALTYAAPQNPSGHLAPIEFVRDRLLPEVSRRVLSETGYRTFFYGNFNRERTGWYTYSSQPRFGAPYRGLRGMMAILSEAYAYASFEDRVRATLAFVRECFEFTVERADEVRAISRQAAEETIEAGRNPDGADLVGVRHRIAAFPEPVVIPGFVEEAPQGGGRPMPTDALRDYTVQHFGRFEPTLTVPRPWGYLIPPHLSHIAEKLTEHGVRVDRLGASGDAAVEVYTIDAVQRAEREFQGHRAVLVEATPRRQTRRVSADWLLVRSAQPLGTLAAYLLEPESDDGLTHWGFLDRWLGAGREFPILRVPRREAWLVDARGG